ncbi:MAG: hypothetical protein Q9166_005095 [cf. Caloplaca sp. 2 TL-2023]
MSFKNRSVSEILQPRTQQSLPSLGEVFDEHERTPNLDASSPHRNLDFEPAPVQAQGSERSGIRQVSSAEVAEVMQRTMATLRQQIHANGFTDEDIRKAREADMIDTYAKASREVVKDEAIEEEADEEYDLNPYQDRADDIGLSHRIPGVGHLGDLLTPPNWAPGDEPIPPKHARQLQKEAYDAAKIIMAGSVAEIKDLKGAAFQEASDAKNGEWQRQTQLAKLIFEERVKVYQMHQERKKLQTQAGQERLGEQTPVLRLPYPNISQVQDLPCGVTEPGRYTYGRPDARYGGVEHPADSLNQPEPSPKILSPSFLDPSLVPGTVDTVLQKYHAKKAEIRKLEHDNELQLKQCLTKYGPHLGPGCPPAQQSQSVSRYLGPGFQPRQRTISTTQHLPYDLASSRLENEEINGGKRDDHKENNRPTPYHYALPPGQNALGIYQEDRGDEPVELALSSPLKQFDDELKTPQLPQPPHPTSDRSSTPSKKLTPREGNPQKQPVWYASHLENANLPTSTISESALQAGLAYDPKGPPKLKETTQPTIKKRRRNGEEVPVPEFKMPADKIRAMFASTLPMRYTGPGPNPYLTESGTAGQGNEGDDTPARKKTKGKAETKAKARAPVPEVPTVDADATVSDCTDELDDDEKDGTYGGKRKTGTPIKEAKVPKTPRKTKTPRMTKAQMSIEAQMNKEGEEVA